ncbi:MAG TPA: efflux RND transporter periplasmic adaptor subunit [Thermoanaerobaculia bacterium]|nr:efflux RND transporter periplasmic adaptor subunit [Thermoanaerobaculia bacterium]
MTRRTGTLIVVALLLLGSVSAFVWNRLSDREEHRHAEEAATYYCPMHPTVTSDRPGSCPICGMRLVKRTQSRDADVAAQIAAGARLQPEGTTIGVSPNQQVLANVRVEKAVLGTADNELVTTGRVTFDERRVAQVTSYTGGRVEQLFANFTGDFVRRGTAVATVYSPDLYAAQREYVVALQNRERTQASAYPQARAAADQLVESSRRRLLLLGFPSSQIDRIARGSLTRTVPIVATVSGVVTRKFVVPQQNVMAGEPLVELADLSVVWVEADISEADLPRVSIGQRAAISSPSLPGSRLDGRVAFIQPVVAGASRTVRVRIELPNRNLQLRPEMYVSVTLFGSAGRAVVTVPASAVIDRGGRQFVWVSTGPATFAARQVTVGTRTSDRVEILSGLTAGEAVVSEGAFLIDSEAQIRAATAGATHGTQGH